MSESYCLDCKEPTPDVKARIMISSDGRPFMSSECGSCGRGKCKYIPQKNMKKQDSDSEDSAEEEEDEEEDSASEEENEEEGSDSEGSENESD